MGRWKGRVKGLAAMSALALLRTLATISGRCCDRDALHMRAGYAAFCPRLLPEHSLECTGALERPRSHLGGGARNAAAVQPFAVHFTPMHTRTALYGSRMHCWLQWAVSGRNLTRKGPVDAHD